ncbi:related to NIMA-like protein kinase [Cephalotrichum gorgonifer]|uniref:non-specific serine/threonine protein kinase n=1 Tax=Cephalotrichum gorgonifer TaxID=2041049 RepID=A0AAE8SSZ0_9PEZI|nr:related to NIMA-like protein kinase [Cephalotrichum gorgonifer]
MSTTTSHEYDVLEKIGHGSFGIIRKVKRKSDGLIVCRKEINYGKMSQKEREQLHAEFQCLSSLRHPNIVAYYHREHLKTQQELHLYMEYCGSGDLGRVIKDLRNKGQRATESFVWHTFSQLVSALYRCHYGVDPPEIGTDYLGLIEGAQNRKAPQGKVVIMHRDLKPENVFLGQDNSVKLGDFGLSKMIKSQDFASTYVGTPYYMSPEICAAERYTLKSDIWSLGCIIYELCAREPPFNAKTHYQLVQKIKTGKYNPLPSCYSDELSATIQECLRINPDERPSTFNLLQLPIMRLMRKERELVDMNSSIKSKEEALSAREARLAEEVAALEASKDYIRQEIDASLRREWEVKAQLEINKHINMEVENLQRQFEVEVRARVEAELKRRAVVPATAAAGSEPAGPQVDSVAKSSGEAGQQPSLADGAGATGIPSTTTSIPDITTENPEVTRRFQGTPMRRVQTMFAGHVSTPGDVEMSEPSPVAISSLALSPRRNAGAKAPAATSGNIFRAAAAANPTSGTGDLVWNVPRDARTPDSDDDDPIPSPTRNIRSNKNPFMARNRPVLTTSKSMAAVTSTNKPLPTLPGGGTSPDAHNRPATAHPLDRSPSPSRRLSKIPSAANLANRYTEPAPTLTRKLSSKSDAPLNKVAAKNNINIRGRTLVELQQARAGGRPLSAVMAPAPGLENVSPKRAATTAAATAAAKEQQARVPGARRSSDSTPAVWDPERDEMPSPFLGTDVRGAGRDEVPIPFFVDAETKARWSTGALSEADEEECEIL